MGWRTTLVAKQNTGEQFCGYNFICFNIIVFVINFLHNYHICRQVCPHLVTCEPLQLGVSIISLWIGQIAFIINDFV
jgi:hypothetical protein